MRSLILISLAVMGQCPGGVCYPQTVVYRGAPSAPSTLWQLADKSGQAWTSPDPEWLKRWVEQKNGEIDARLASTPAPVATPPPVEKAKPKTKAKLVQETPDGSNFGVNYERFPQVAGKEWYGGNFEGETPKVGAARQKRLHLTVVGEGAKGIVAGWRKDSSEFVKVESSMGEQLVVKSYEPGEKTFLVISGLGFESGGRPDVVLQNESGKVLHRWRSDPGGDLVAGEVRRRDPNYSPAKDPDSLSAGPEFLGIPISGWALAGVVVALILGGKSR